MTDLVNTIKQNLETNKPINKIYTTLNNIQLNNNNKVERNFESLKQSLTNSLTNITFNTNTIKNALTKYKELYKKTAINVNNKRRNINIAISERIKIINANIQKKTETLNKLMKSINDNIENLKLIINNNTSIFNQQQKDALGQIIITLSASIVGSTKNFNDNNNKLIEIVAILKKLIGEFNSISVPIGPGNGTFKGNNTNNAQAKVKANAAKAKVQANANTVQAKVQANANAVQAKAVQVKKMKNLTNTNINKSFSYKKNGTNIGFTYKGKTNNKKFRIIRNGNFQEQQLSTNKNSGLLNKNIFPKNKINV